MFVIQITDVVNILNCFHCDNSVSTIDLVSYYQSNEKVIMIIKAITLSGEYILKLYSDTIIDKQRENLQCAFSEFLFLSGIPLPHKYNVEGEYVVGLKLGSLFFLVTVEDVFGSDVTIITETSALELGRILGSMHNVSVLADYHLPFGIAYRSLFSPKVEYKSIWGNVTIDCLNKKLIENTKLKHDESIKVLRSLWKGLPTYAVHGDLALTSNIMFDERRGYGVIDFNLSGDEVLLGDLLITWYSSRYSDAFIKQVPSQKVPNIRNAFLTGYFNVRQLNEKEAEIFEKSSKIINGLYFSKYVANRLKQNNTDYISLYTRIADNFDCFDFLDILPVL